MTPPTKKTPGTGTRRGPRRRPESSQAPRQSVEGASRADSLEGSLSCPRCAEELSALGLPYRIVLRCTHGVD